MSKAHTDKRDAPIRRYLLRALAKLNLTSTQHCCLLVIMDDTYGWVADRESKRRKDRAEFSLEYLAQETGAHKVTVSKALADLIEKNILTVFEEHSKHRSRVLGIQSDPDLWGVKKEALGLAGSLTQESSLGLAGSLTQTIQIANPRRSRSLTQESSEADNHAELRPTESSINLVKNLEEAKTPVHQDFFQPQKQPDLITCPRVANRSELTPEEAAIQAERFYCSKFVGPVRAQERKRIQQKMRLGRPGGLLALWILANNKSKAERRAARREGKKTWNNLFAHVEDCFARLFDEQTDKQARADEEPVGRAA